LRNLITRVDQAWFGKRPAAIEDYRAARGSFQAFSTAASEERA
jgi:hypothetical protein